MKSYIYDEDANAIGEIIMYDNARPGKNIGLVIGHSSDSQGAYGNSGKGEFDFNDEFVDELLLRSGADKRHTYYTFYRCTNIQGYSNQMKDLHKRMDNVGIDISIEFHFNSVTDSSVNGNEVLYCSDAGSELADILDECLDSLPNRDRGTKKVTKNDRGGGFCCRGKSVALITEPFFAVNQDKYVYGGEERKTLIDAYLEFFKKI